MRFLGDALSNGLGGIITLLAVASGLTNWQSPSLRYVAGVMFVLALWVVLKQKKKRVAFPQRPRQYHPAIPSAAHG